MLRAIHVIRLAPAASLLLAFLVLGCGQAPPTAEVTPPAPVQAMRAWEETLDEWTELPGTTQPLPNQAARVTAAVEGRVLSVLPASRSGQTLAEGQHVEPDQIIVQLDDTLARTNRAKVARSLEELTAQKRQAENALQLARDVLQRREKLKSESSSGTELISAAELEKTRSEVRNAEAQVQAVEAKERSGQAELEALDQQLKYYALRAPIAGQLGTMQVVPGQTIAVGTTVAEIVNLDRIDVLGFVPPSRVSQMALKAPARMMTADAPDQSDAAGPEGEVVYIAVQAQPETGSFPVKVRFLNKDLHLRANALVQVRIRTQQPKKRLVISTDALMEDQDPPAAVIVTNIKDEKDGKVGEVRVREASVGVRNRQQHLAEILGLEQSENDKKDPLPSVRDAWFVVVGGHGLKDGDAVKVEEVAHEEKK